MHHEKPHGKTRGRPKSKTDDSKEGNIDYIYIYLTSFSFVNF